MNAKTRKITLKLFLLVKSWNGIVCQNFKRRLQMHAEIFGGTEKDTNTDAKKIDEAIYVYFGSSISKLNQFTLNAM